LIFHSCYVVGKVDGWGTLSHSLDFRAAWPPSRAPPALLPYSARGPRLDRQAYLSLTLLKCVLPLLFAAG
jgi:hypothetical protein